MDKNIIGKEKTLKIVDFIQFLESLLACRDAVKYVETKQTPQQAWNDCDRGDWMLWLLGHTTNRKTVVEISCRCARLALKHVPAGEERPRIAIETAERWCKKEATLVEVRNAAADADAYAAAYAAAHTAYAAAHTAVHAAFAAAYAADYAADAAAYAAHAAAHTAVHAAYAADYAADAAADARKQTLLKCAKIVRLSVPKVPTKVLQNERT